MKPKYFCLLLLVALACGKVTAQNDEELNIPIENNNQFPPDANSEPEGIIEGSGAGVLEEPFEELSESASTPAIPELEEIQPAVPTNNEIVSSTDEETSCPKPCVCHVEGDSSNYVVDCSGYGLTELPTPIDFRTTTLNLQNNHLTEIPKEISVLKNLQILNVKNNSLMDLALGSVSELPELVTLTLTNNRLLEFPQDLKNAFTLSKLAELDLGGNDMRTTLSADSFANFKSLRQVVLPTSNSELIESMCLSLKDTLEVVCTNSCADQSFECPDALHINEDDLLDVLPETVVHNNVLEDSGDPIVDSDKEEANSVTEDATNDKPETTSDSSVIEGVVATPSVSNENNTLSSDFSFRSAVIQEPEGIAKTNDIFESPKEITSASDHADVKVGATTVDSKTGGVDKSVIGLVVAGMVLIVAGITIKKNWSSIRKRFSSQPRARNERANGNTNGTTAPEEMPLQDKSPV